MAIQLLDVKPANARTIDDRTGHRFIEIDDGTGHALIETDTGPEEEPILPARGIIVGLLLSMPFWILIASLLYWLL